jgi:16S rRNA (cytidine1402-2'-O)-methyltransferase
MGAVGTLSVIGTPIGNLEDVTLRALRVLREADVILCEDTRVTKKLLARYKIAKPLLSYHEHSSIVKIAEIVELLKGGKNLALVTDAGTPGISDPGAQLVRQIRTHMESSTSDVESIRCGEIKIEAVSGPSALTAALSVAGVPASEFVFLGFLPHKKGRETLFKEIAASERAMIFYESPHRILKTLESLKKFLSPTSRLNLEVGLKRITVCRELTKIHEEVKSGSAAELLEFFNNNPEKVRGEFVVVVAP